MSECLHASIFTVLLLLLLLLVESFMCFANRTACKMFVCVRVRMYGASNNGNGLLKDHIVEKKGEIINKEAAAAAAALATTTATLRQ